MTNYYIGYCYVEGECKRLVYAGIEGEGFWA